MNLGYTGKPYNSTTGMYDYGYRDYKPEVARFTTIDPIRDGANWFSYVNNDPVNYTDPWGLSARDKTGFKGVLKNILGKINAAPVTVAGLVAGAVLTGVSVITGNGGKISIENNAITFTAGLGLPGSITLGNTIIHAKGSIENWNSKTISKRYDGLAGILLGRHEEEHTYQYETYGVLMPIMWGITIIQNGKMGKSPFEIAADNASEIPGTRK
jgi:RHS repeat-associated protein